MSREEFLKEIKPHAIKSYDKSGILPSVLGAQASLETGFGESELSQKARNLFGVKGEYNGESYTVRTEEQDKDGNSSYIDAAFRKYPSYTESFKDRANFFTSTPWRTKIYAPVTKAKGYKAQVKALDESPYATDVEYGKKLLSIIEQYKLYEWDKEVVDSIDIPHLSPVEYLMSKGFRITSNPDEYYESYNPNHGKKEWGKRDLWEWHNGRKIYHDDYCGGWHLAFDLSIKEGADLPAVVDGIIVAGTSSKGNFGGTAVLADHKGHWQYIYGHCKNLKVKVGDTVKQGDKLAEQSSTNYYNNPMNSHLHFQTQKQEYLDEKEFVCSGVNPENINVEDYVSNDHPFLAKLKAYIMEDYKSSKILPSVTAAQAALESGWGESELAQKANNIFGVKGDYKGQSYTIKTREEDENGKSYYVNAPFRKYPSFKESIEDHGAFFTSTPWRTKNYKSVLSAKDYVTQSEALQSSGYATDKQYSTKLIELIEEYNLAIWDEEATGKAVAPSKPSVNKPSPPAKQANSGEYAVEKGDTLWSISQANELTVDEIKQLNGLSSNEISIGQMLKVSNSSTKAKTHKVAKGETLWSISQKYGKTVAQIKGFNALTTNTLSIGQVLRVGKNTKKSTKFNKYQTKGRRDKAYFKGTVEIAEVRKRNGSQSKGFNWNEKAGYDIATGQTVYIFEVHEGWGRIYTNKLKGKGSNDWIHMDRVTVTEVF